MLQMAMAFRTINFGDANSLKTWLASIEERRRQNRVGTWETSHSAIIKKLRKRLEESKHQDPTSSSFPNKQHVSSDRTVVDADWVGRVFRITEAGDRNMQDEMVLPLHFNVVLSEFRGAIDAVSTGNSSLALSTLLEKLCLNPSPAVDAQRSHAYAYLHHYLGSHPPLDVVSRTMWMEVFTLASLADLQKSVGSTTVTALPSVQFGAVVAQFQKIVKNAFLYTFHTNAFRFLLLSVLEHDYAGVLVKYVHEEGGGGTQEDLSNSETCSIPLKKAKTRAQHHQQSGEHLRDKAAIDESELDYMPLACLALAKIEGELVCRDHRVEPQRFLEDLMRKFHNFEESEQESRMLYVRLVALLLDSYLHHYCGAETRQTIFKLAKELQLAGVGKQKVARAKKSSKTEKQGIQGKKGSLEALFMAKKKEEVEEDCVAVKRCLAVVSGLPLDFKNLLAAVGGWLDAYDEVDKEAFQAFSSVEWLNLVYPIGVKDLFGRIKKC